MPCVVHILLLMAGTEPLAFMQKLIPILLLLWLAGAGVGNAQAPEPGLLGKLRLSGLSGTTDHRLAIINNRTFSQGEKRFVKLAGTKVQVKCLEIGEGFVLVQIQDLASPYVLNMAGKVILLGPPSPVSAPKSQPVAAVQQPVPTSPTPAPQVVSSSPAILPHPEVNRRTFLSMPLFWLLLLFALGSICVRWSAARSGTGIRYNNLERENVGEIRVTETISQQLDRTDHLPTNLGETLVAETISQQLERPHQLLNDTTLPTPDGTTQIDHILVADTGIFVIETKHHTGWIFGDPKKPRWTQMIHRKKFQFQNPLHQNYGHVKNLQSLFDFPDDYFHSLVVFTGDAEFKTNVGPQVIQRAQLIEFLNEARPIVFDESKMAEVVSRIEMKRKNRSAETDEAHIKYVNRKKAGRIQKPSLNTTWSAPQPTVDLATMEHPHSRYMPKN
jgi:hypothetical protein